MENVHKIDKNCDLAGVSCPLLISPPQLNTFHCHSREFHGVNPFASLTKGTEYTPVKYASHLTGQAESIVFPFSLRDSRGKQNP